MLPINNFLNNSITSQQLKSIKLYPIKEINLLSFGDKQLDEQLGGGIPPNTIIHIYGKSSSGKTQLALQCAIQVQLDKELGGWEKNVLYISSDKNIPIERLNQLINQRKTQSNLLGSKQEKDLLKGITIIHSPNLDRLEDIIYKRLEEQILIQKENLGLMIIDNIYDMCLQEEDEQLKVRLALLITKLKNLQEQYQFGCFIINQVYDQLPKEKEKEEVLFNHELEQLEPDSTALNFKLPFLPKLGRFFRNLCPTSIILLRMNSIELKNQYKNITNINYEESLHEFKGVRKIYLIGRGWLRSPSYAYFKVESFGLLYWKI